MSVFLPGQLLVRLDTKPLTYFDHDAGVLDGVYLVIGIIDNDFGKVEFIDYAEYTECSNVSEHNFQYRMIAPDGTIVYYNVPYMDDKYRVIS